MRSRDGVRYARHQSFEMRLGTMQVLQMECDRSAQPEPLLEEAREGTRRILQGAGFDVTYALGAQAIYDLESLSRRTELTADSLDAFVPRMNRA